MDVREKLIDLKPCPFCGGEAITEGRKCFMSGLRMSAFLDEFLTEEEAIEAWNRRAGEEKQHEAL